MKVRTVTNAGFGGVADAPLVDSQGNLLAGARVSFQLIDRNGRPVRNVMDAESNETISPGTAVAVSDVDGLFSIAIWPTSRGANSYYYRVRVVSAVGRDIADFNASLPDGDSALLWGEFMALAGLWANGSPFSISATTVVLVDPETNRAFQLGVAIDSDTLDPTTSYTEVENG